MNSYVQLELFDLSTYHSTDAGLQKDNILLFQSRPQNEYEQLTLDLKLDLLDDDQSSEAPEAA
jgi:hypothetical protein